MLQLPQAEYLLYTYKGFYRPVNNNSGKKWKGSTWGEFKKCQMLISPTYYFWVHKRLYKTMIWAVVDIITPHKRRVRACLLFNCDAHAVFTPWSYNSRITEYHFCLKSSYCSNFFFLLINLPFFHSFAWKWKILLRKGAIRHKYYVFDLSPEIK